MYELQHRKSFADLVKMQSKSDKNHIAEHSSGVCSHRCSSTCVLLLLYSPTVGRQRGLLRKKKRALQVRDEESVCSLQLCSLKETTLRRDVTPKIKCKSSYLGRNSQRQRKKHKGYKHYDQVFPKG